MRIPKLEFQKYIDSKYEECLELFELNCPTYFAEEERKDYRQFLEHDRDVYLHGNENHFFCMKVFLLNLQEHQF